MALKLNRRALLGTAAAALGAAVASPVLSAAANWETSVKLHVTPLEYDPDHPEMAEAVRLKRDSWWLAENMRVTRAGGFRGDPHRILRRRAVSRCYFYNPASIPEDVLLWDQAEGEPKRVRRIAPTSTKVVGLEMPHHGTLGAPAFYFDFVSEGDIPAIAFERSTFLESTDPNKGTWMLVCAIEGAETVLPTSDLEGVWISPGHLVTMLSDNEGEMTRFYKV